MLVSARPDSKLFHIVAEERHAAGPNFRGFAEKLHGLFDSAKRNQIAKFLQAWEQPDGLAPIFGDVWAKELFGLESCSKKWQIVHQGIGDLGGGKRRGELRLPDALRQPASGRPFGEMFFNVVSQAIELFDAIGFGDRNENRFVKAAANQFDLATRCEVAKADKIARMVLLDPQKQRARIMDGNANGGMLFQQVQK